MYFHLFHTTFNFLKTHLEPHSRLLLAFSGGPDSTALLYQLLEVQKKIPFKLELAHIDHGQRETSSKEALSLKALADDLGLPFYLKTLKETPKGNLEDAYRNERLQFFKEIYQKRECSALLIAHQREDLEETVLKRFFEGAQFEKLSAMKPVSSFYGMLRWRPFLEVSKTEILKWLDQNQISYIQDYTNRDERFLRARMRESLIPQIEKGFGKNIRSTLVRYSKSASSLEAYMLEQTKTLRNPLEGPFGSFYDFSKKELHPYEVQFALKAICESQNLSFSFDQLGFIESSICSGEANKELFFGKKRLLVDRKRLFILDKEEFDLLKILPLTCGQHVYGPWKVLVERGEDQIKNQLGINALFQKNSTLFIQLPLDEYQLKIPNLALDRFGFDKRVSSWFATHKIPSALASLLPVIQKDNGVFAELLTAKTPFENSTSYLNITLTYKKD